MSNLVIIESPGKTKALENYLGRGYKVVASKGHVRDLPKSSLGVDIENGFTANYVNIRKPLYVRLGFKSRYFSSGS